MATFILATMGAKALGLLYVWLASAWVASAISVRKGYTEKVGLGTGLLLSVVGVLIWLVVPSRTGAAWRKRGFRRHG